VRQPEIREKKPPKYRIHATVTLLSYSIDDAFPILMDAPLDAEFAEDHARLRNPAIEQRI
jgi:hypothetical protein